MSVVQPVEIIDKNGKRNTVRKKLEPVSSDKVRKVSVRSAADNSQSFDHPAFPDVEERETIKMIRKVFKGAVEFRFEFELDGGSLYLMNRAVVMDDGGVCSDELGTEEELQRLDSVSDRLADIYYLLGAFGSHKRVRVVNQESENRYVAIRLD